MEIRYRVWQDKFSLLPKKNGYVKQGIIKEYIEGWQIVKNKGNRGS